MKARAHLLPCLLVVLLALGACSRHEDPQPSLPPPSDGRPLADPRLTYENFGALKTGMNEDQVRQILGKPSAIDAQDVKGTDQRVVYTYRDPLNAITVNFINGALSSKTCDLQDKPAPPPAAAPPSKP